MSEQFRQRARAESFGRAADEYDRRRPSYPAALIDDLVAPAPQRVLDVGTGTGKAAILLAARGVDVLGVEVDPAMAAVARRHGLTVEVGSFESWEDGGRTFDLITCAQAWHWIDPAAGIPKAARLLRRSGGTPGDEGIAAGGGTLVLFWNYDVLDEPVQQALDDVYRRIAPELTRSVVLGGTRQIDEDHVSRLQASAWFADVEVRTYPWELARSRDEWVAMVRTHSDHLALEPDRLDQLAAALRATIDDLGGQVRSRYTTTAVFAKVAG
jgi:SAM-dependent methyltransferase